MIRLSKKSSSKKTALLIILLILTTFTLYRTSVNPIKGTKLSVDEIKSTNAPILTEFQPENLSIVSDFFELSVKATGVTSVSYRELLAQTSSIAMEIDPSDSERYRAIIDSTQYPNGVTFFEITASDDSNNQVQAILLLAVDNIEADIFAYNVTGLTKDCPCLDDANSSIFWKDIQGYPIPEFNGNVKFSHNFTHLFGLFIYDSSYEWISLQFDTDGDTDCMEPGSDLWVFYDDNPIADYTAGKNIGILDTDKSQDIIYEMGILPENNSLKFVEIIRPFATSDGDDVIFQFGIPATVLFASDTVHQSQFTQITLALNPATPPTDGTGPISPGNNKLPPIENMTDLFLFGGIGFIINTILILAIIIYNRRRTLASN